MNVYDSVLELIGNTPLVRLNKIVKPGMATIYAKLENLNPGGSVKDRMAWNMVRHAEQAGLLKPGATLVESTSGNTGLGLAMTAAVRGYRAIFTMPDKMSQEKIDMLKALGAEVIVCPTNVTPDYPRSYYSVADKLSKEIPNSFWCNQYDNLANTQAHYESTGPEIWEQTEGKITHLVVGVGTGGTVSGTAKYLKEKNPNIKVWGIDTFGSVFKKYKETGQFDEKEIYPYITEGIGEDILPKNVNFDLIDHFEKVTDKDGALAARRLAREEGLLLGYSAGSALAGLLQMKDQLTKDDVVVIIFHDHGSRYVDKIFNDDWMRDRGFLDLEKSVRDLLTVKKADEFIAVSDTDRIRDVFELMKAHDISQVPVLRDGQVIGSIIETTILKYLLDNPLKHADEPIAVIMGAPFPVIERSMKLKELQRFITRETPAVLVRDDHGTFKIITQYDLIHAV